jgi:hypothetical protein
MQDGELARVEREWAVVHREGDVSMSARHDVSPSLGAEIIMCMMLSRSVHEALQT